MSDTETLDDLARAALLLLEDGNPMAAQAAASDLLAQDAGRPEGLFVAGATAFQMGDGVRAEAMFRRLADAAPDEPTAHFNLANALKMLGRSDEAIEGFRRAIALAPDYAAAHNNLGNVLSDSGDEATAIEAYRQAVAVDPHHAQAWANLGNSLRAEGSQEEAVASLRRAVDLEPAVPSYRVECAATLAAADEAAEALSVIDQGLQDFPGQPGLLAARMQLLAAAGRADEVRAIADLARTLFRITIKPPEGFADIAAFNQALADHVVGHPGLAAGVAGERRVEDLLAEPGGPMPALRDILGAVVTEYVRLLPDDAEHPFLRFKPENFHLHMWAVVTAADAGQPVHVQPGTWLSGVYWVSGATASASQLQLGAPMADFPAGAGAAALETVPVEDGMVLAHPSCVSSSMAPAAVERIAVAFGVVPVVVDGAEPEAAEPQAEATEDGAKPGIGKIRLLDN